ncbi:hypothetical protein SH501x_000708 [Pirellulaceae bacterium SH501]
MSKTITIDCDPKEMRIAVGTSGLTGVSVEQVLSAPLDMAPNEDYLESPKTLAALQLLLKKGNIRSGNAVVCVARSNVELRSVHVPTVDKNEMPDMVRFAAQRQFANVGDSWPIDFVTLGPTPDGMTEVLAASVNPARIDRLEKILEDNGLKFSQLVLRPMVASTVALLKRAELANQVTLFVDLLQQEADMAIVDGKHVVFMRTIRFDSEQDEASRNKTISSEIKRTLLSAASQFSNLSVTQVVVWGSLAAREELCRTLSENLSLPVSSLDPFELADVSAKAKSESAMESGKYAAAIGALFAPSYHEHLIDFKHPRKREEKKVPILTYSLAGAAAALVVGFCSYSYFASHADLDRQIADLNNAIKQNETSVKLATQKEAEWKKIETFLAGNYSWLEELEYLSEKSLPADKAMFGSATFATDARGANASISSKFIFRDNDDAPEMQSALRDPGHEINATGIAKNPDRSGKYPWSSDLTIRLASRKVEDPRKSKFVPVPETNTPPEASALPASTDVAPKEAPANPSQSPTEPKVPEPIAVPEPAPTNNSTTNPNPSPSSVEVKS